MVQGDESFGLLLLEFFHPVPVLSDQFHISLRDVLHHADHFFHLLQLLLELLHLFRRPDRGKRCPANAMLELTRRRTATFQQSLRDAGIALALLISDADSIAYLAGFWGYLGIEFGRPTLLLIPQHEKSGA